jgi:hypothetical protein
VYAQSQAPASEFEDITPIMTVGSAGIGTLLANRIAADTVMVNGYDVLKLDQGILQLIQRKTLTQNSELDAVVAAAKVSRLLRIKASAPAPQNPPPGGTVVR